MPDKGGTRSCAIAHRCRLLLAVLFSTLLTLSAPAMAWNAAGHRLTAAIAWRAMDADTRQRVASLLAHHPDHALWGETALKKTRTQQEPGTANDPGYAAFLEASTWPDDIKRDQRFFDDGEAATPLLPGFTDMARHRDWHYVDYPLDAPPTVAASGELALRLPVAMHTLADRQRPASERAIALAWLIHLVADAHQPLHTASRFDADGHGDEGGNRQWIEDPFNPRRSSMSLHAYWDDLPGPPWLRGPALERAVDAMAGALTNTEAKAAAPGSPAQWIAESHRLAKTVVYAGIDGEVPEISRAYNTRALQTARDRVALAGQRLGQLLGLLLRD